MDSSYFEFFNGIPDDKIVLLDLELTVLVRKDELGATVIAASKPLWYRWSELYDRLVEKKEVNELGVSF